MPSPGGIREKSDSIEARFSLFGGNCHIALHTHLFGQSNRPFEFEQFYSFLT